jgi:hypothetical protein
MASLSPNRYINNYIFGPTQKLFEDLTIGAIKNMGFWVNYLPRTSVNLDDLFGESTVNSFNDAVMIEAYPNNTEGFDGARFMSKFDVQIKDELHLSISRKRFEEVRLEHLMSENDDTMEQEVTNRYMPGQLNGILMEEGNIEGYYIPYDRPREGDLIWVSTFQRLFEIKFVQHDAIFYQGGSLQTYELFCELFEYSHEKLDTGDTEIDSIEDLFSGDLMRSPMTTEDDDSIKLEDDTDQATIIDEDVQVEDTDKQADNKLLTDEADGVVDFSEISPFVKRNTDFKW